MKGALFNQAFLLLIFIVSYEYIILLKIMFAFIFCTSEFRHNKLPGKWSARPYAIPNLRRLTSRRHAPRRDEGNLLCSQADTNFRIGFHEQWAAQPAALDMRMGSRPDIDLVLREDKLLKCRGPDVQSMELLSWFLALIVNFP